MSDPIWRPDEGSTRAHPESDSKTTSPDLWRAGEGAVLAPEELTRTRSGPEGSDDFRAEEGIRERRSIRLKLASRDRRKKLSARRGIGFLLSAVIALFLADAIYAGTELVSALSDVRDALRRGGQTASRGDLTLAAQEVSVARRRAADALASTQRPSVRLVSAVPLIGTDARAVRRAARSAQFLVDAARAGLRAAQALDLDEDGVAKSIIEDGSIRFDALDRTRPFIQRATGLLDQAERELLGVDPLLAATRNAVADGVREVQEARSVMERGSVLLDFLPAFLAKNSQRRYLLVFQALSEARATGGLAGLYGVLNIEDGQTKLEKVGPFSEAVPARVSPVDAPRWFKEAYGPQSALKEWRQVNVSPNFPAVAKIWLRMYESANDVELDGVIAMDPIALADLLKATGPIRDPVSGDSLTSSNAADALLHDSYVEFDDPARQSIYLSRMVERFWADIRTGEFDSAIFGSELGTAVAEQHIKVYPGTARERRQSRILGADGWIDPGMRNVQMVFHNNYGRNKVDYYLQRSVETDIDIQSNGNALVRTLIKLSNQAPPGPPSLLLGDGGAGFPPGTNRLTLNVLLAAGAEVKRFEIDGQASPNLVYRERSHPVIWDILEIRPGERVDALLEYVIPNAVAFDEHRGNYFSIDFVPQAAVRGETFTFSLSAPPDYVLEDSSERTSNTTERYQSGGVLERSKRISLYLLPG